MGWKTSDMLDGIEGIMNLAAASGEDLALTSDIVTDALTAFGMSAKQAGEFSDLLAATASNSNTNVSMLGESFKYVAPIAGALGMSAKDTAFALGLMANAGIKSSQSGTALRASLTNLAKPTKSMNIEMNKLGISLLDANGNVKEGKALYDELREKFSGLTDAQKTQSAATIFGKEAMSGMLAVINASEEDYNKLYDSLNDSAGAAENMADIMNNNLKGQVTLLKSALEGLGIQLYESINNPMKEVVKTTNSMVGQLSKAFEKGGFEGLVIELGNVFSQIVTNIASSAPKFIDLAVQTVQSFITGIKNNLPQIVKAAMGIIRSLVDGILTLLPQILELGLNLIIELGKGIAESIPEMLPNLIQVMMGICDMIIGNIGIIIDVGIDIILALVEGIVQNLPTLIQEIPRIINSFADALYSCLPRILKAGMDIIIMLVKGLITSIPIIIQNLPQIIMAIINVFTLVNWASLGKNLITGIGNGIKAMVPNIGAIANFTAESVIGGIKGIFTSGGSIGRNLISWIANGIRGSVGSLLQAARNVAVSALQGIKSILGWNEASSIGANLIRGIWNGISNMSGWIINLIGGFSENVINSIKGFFGIHSPSRIMRDLIGTNIVKGIGVGIDIETPNLKKDIDSNMVDLIQRMHATVDYETAKTTATVIAKNNSYDNKDNNTAGATIENKSIIEVPVIIEGEKVAKATAPYSDKISGQRLNLTERGLIL
ncbi:phage tail tape measure protein [Clostridium septicum]|uniref:Phage tail tape measure protein n=1 Tax=Clostridium septicum TaxID=1504 RepID=A0A9N7JMI1_CLOSE|nr:phage tail tape measure protein [Clostridium septicum]AYE35318.1 phage tail tape measure protein [Clostridium septicum]UEC20026.1 phage tail tape measure protein [Clostridium septicum]USS01917.1 phage tail tape measure protein [Clostridium septicum]